MAQKSGGKRTDTVVRLVLIFFISLLSFSVGTFVGKQVSDDSYRQAALEEDYKPFRSTASEESKEEVTEEDVVSLTEEFIEKEKPNKESAHRAVASDEKAHETHDDKKDYKKLTKDHTDKDHSDKHHSDEPKKKEQPKKSKTAHVSEEAQKVAHGNSPSKDKEKKRKPNSVLPAVATSAIGKYTVQVASYAAEDEAKGHAAQLKSKGWNAFYVPAEVKGNTWFRVSVGLFSNYKSALSFRTEVLREKEISSAIVQKIVQ